MLQPANLLQLALLHGCFIRFLDCTNGTKLCKAAPILLELAEGFMKKSMFELNEESFKRTRRSSNRTKFTRPCATVLLADYEGSFFLFLKRN